jgi:two-component system sensor kinase FixL
MGLSPRRSESPDESEQRLRAIFDGARDAIIVIDESGIIQPINKATVSIFGYEADEILGRNVSVLMPKPDANKHDGRIQKYLRSGQGKVVGYDREVEGRRKAANVCLSAMFAI